MNELRVSLFGKFCLQRAAQSIPQLDSCKVQELFCYLLLHRTRPHPRELIASLLWGDQTTSRSKQYLRKALWQLQSTLGCEDEADDRRLLLINAEWIEINANAELWLDVSLFETAYATTQGIPGAQLDRTQADSLAAAIDLYQGDLLEGWYQDWCLIERERFQQMFLSALDKLMHHAEHHQTYEAGLAYGAQILRYDRAREHTHRALMRLYYLAGDRTGALRQYERCVRALNEELGVPPAEQTQSLYEQIRSGQLRPAEPATTATGSKGSPLNAAPASALQTVLPHLKRLHHLLASMAEQVEHEVAAIEAALHHPR
jgi:DNA-binding SARP family transcriptional activator